MSLPTHEEALAHFGVKGMKWGQRKVQDFQKNRQLNKASRAKDRAQRDADIDAARERFNSGQARKDFLNAKAQFKKDKKTIGSREARKKFNEVKIKNRNDFQTAQMAKSGRETTVAILATVGGVLVSSLSVR